MRVKTKDLKNAVSKLSKLVGKNTIMEICNYIELIVQDYQLILTATDKTNTITARVETEDEVEEKGVIEGNKFISLVRNTSKKEIELNFKDDYLEMKGNGKYKLEYYTGNFPDYQIEPKQQIEVNTEELQDILNKHKGTPSTDLNLQILTGYYLGDKVITLDGQKLAITHKQLFDNSLLIPADLMSLLSLFEDEKMMLMIDGNKLLFDTPELTIFGSQLYGLDEFEELDFSIYLEEDYTNYVEVNVDELQDILKRIEIFTTEEQGYGIILDYNDKLVISDNKNKSREELEVEGNGSFNCEVVINDLNLFLKNTDQETVKLMFDEDKPALKIDADNTHYYSSVIIEEE